MGSKIGGKPSFLYPCRMVSVPIFCTHRGEIPPMFATSLEDRSSSASTDFDVRTPWSDFQVCSWRNRALL